jgi:hypothetical protein
MTQPLPLGQHPDSPARSSPGPTGDGARPTDELILQRLGAAVMLCWNDLPFPTQARILDQANDIIGLSPMPQARNEIVKLLLRHARM